MGYFTTMRNKLLVIMGPTSTGKTDLALYLAQKFNGELISADSRQVYKHLDIGTGKEPSQNSKRKTQIEKEKGFWEINDIKVWMYDAVLPKEKFNLHKYILNAEEIIKKITAKDKLPILVGGTGLYIRTLLDGISDFGSEANEDLRRELESLQVDQIIEKIENKNPGFLKNLNNSEIHNKRRLIRIFEKLSTTASNHPFTGIGKEFDVLKIGLKAKREILNKRIKVRVKKRISRGMIEESEKLLANKILTYAKMDKLGLEYRYIAKYLKAEIKTKKELIEILNLRIKQFAKRQMTWFKKEKEIYWLDISDKDFLQKVDYKVSNWYNINNE